MRGEMSDADREALATIEGLYRDVDPSTREAVWCRWARLVPGPVRNGIRYGLGYSECSMLAALHAWDDARRPEPRLWKRGRQ